MKVKKTQTDDLINSLKQLKISDRRSRLSVRARSSALRGSAALRLTWNSCLLEAQSSRSRSTESCHPVGAHSCEHCLLSYHLSLISESGDSNPTTGTSSCLSGYVSPVSSSNYDRASGFSPFTASAGLLYSALPSTLDLLVTDTEVQLQAVDQSIKLRRSCGACLGCLIPDPPLQRLSEGTSASQWITHLDKHRCPLHHHSHSGTAPILPSVLPRLHRRLYSLIDHPCISFYRSMYPTDLSNPHLPAHLRRSQSSRQPQRPCHSLAEQPVAGAPTSSSFRPVLQQRLSVQLCLNSDHPSDMMANKGNSSRSRRNSDPQPWQQNRPDEPNPSAGPGRLYPAVLSSPHSSLRSSIGEDELPTKPEFSVASARPANFSYVSHEGASSNQRSDLLFRPSQLIIPQTQCFPTFTDSSHNDCTPSGDITPQPLSNLKRPVVPRTRTSSDDQSHMLSSLDQELSLIEQQTESSGDSSRPHAMTDVSVNELAAYMEHMVHIPGRMSEMAQRMYL